MFCDVTKALRLSREAIEQMKGKASPLTPGELDGLSEVVQACEKGIDLIAGYCLMPLEGGIPPLLAIGDPHERAIGGLQFILDQLAKARPINHASQRTLHGVRFATEAVLFALEACRPDNDPAAVRYALAG